MKILIVILTAILTVSGVFGFISPCDAENEILKHECEAKASKASELIRTLGAEAAFKQIANPAGPFVGKNSHVFCVNADNGELLAHKVARFVGVNMHNYTDADYKTPYTSILEKAQKEANGWTSYMTLGSGPDKREIPGLKNMYFLKVPNENIVLCCGYWENS